MLFYSFFAFITTLGFCVIFNIKGRNMIYASLGGSLGWFTYLFCTEMYFSAVFSLFIASVVLGTYSEIMARIAKAPVTTFVVCALIPLVPGGGMYYTMLESIQGNVLKSLEIGLQTLASAGALAVGIVLVSSISKLINVINKKLKVKL